MHDEKTKLIQEGAYIAAKLAPAKKDFQTLSRDVEKMFVEQGHLQEAKCPYCAQQYENAPIKLAALEQEIETKGAKLIEAEQIVSQFTEKAKTQKAELESVEARIQHTNLSELLAARENASVLKTKLDSLRASENPHIEAFERLLTENVKDADHGKLDELRKKLEHQQFLLKLLTNKDSFLRRRIINKSIPFLNDRINFYTAQIGLPHIVKFDADMSCTVSEFGRELDFGNLSAGEKKRVNVGLALAFRDVLHYLHAKCNLLLIDELDGQLDGGGVDSIIKVLKDKSRSLS